MAEPAAPGDPLAEVADDSARYVDLGQLHRGGMGEVHRVFDRTLERVVAMKHMLPWRLPHDLEWEKAARGVDGRRFPFGNHPDAAWAHTLRTAPGKPLPASIHACPVDVSPYGVRGLAGGICDWTADGHTTTIDPLVHDGIAIVGGAGPADGYRSIRGGCWVWHHRHCVSDVQNGHSAYGRTATLGFRLVRSL